MRIVLQIVALVVLILFGVKTGFDLKYPVQTMFALGSETSLTGNFSAETNRKTESETRFITSPPAIAPPKDHPPLRIIAGAYVYIVRYTTQAYLYKNNCGAFTDNVTHEIWLNGNGFEEPRYQREILMHELLHVAKWISKSITVVSEPIGYNANHDFIEPASPELLSIIQTNPRLMEWLEKR